MIAAVLPAVAPFGPGAAPDAPAGAGEGVPAFAAALTRALAPRGKPAAGDGKDLPADIPPSSKDEDEAPAGEAPAAPTGDVARMDPAALAVFVQPLPVPPTPGIPAAESPATGSTPVTTPSQAPQGVAAIARPLPTVGVAPSSSAAMPALLEGALGTGGPGIQTLRLPGEGRGAAAGASLLAPGLRRAGNVDRVNVAVPVTAGTMPGQGEGRADSATPTIAVPSPATMIAAPRADAAASAFVAPVLATVARVRPEGMPRIVTGRTLRERAAEPAALVTPITAGTAPAIPGPATPEPAPVAAAATIARIEALRDAADAIDTAIRIVPDALGAIEVAVRRDGEVTHVHLAAEQPQTARLLAEAQPRLTEIAEARGLKLGTTTSGIGGDAQSGADPGGQPPHRQPAPADRPTAPRRAPRAIAHSDHRIA